MSRRVLVRTLALGNGNYGGILQAFALQKILSRMGASVDTDTSVPPTIAGCMFRLLHPVKQQFTKVPWLRQEAERASNWRLEEFVAREMSTVRLYRFRKRPRSWIVRQYDTFIAGSDQVWRPAYARVQSYLFDFLPEEFPGRRFSYAASFGTDNLTSGDTALLATATEYARRLNVVSVRESGGVQIAQSVWGVKALQHLDPTMLLDVSEYEQLIEAALPDQSARTNFGIVAYVLDRDSFVDSVISKAEQVLNSATTDLSPRRPATAIEYRKSPEKFDKASIPEWLSAIKSCSLLITDSFHGCVFAILFGVPFIVVPNHQRGQSRFDSLLSLFGLEDRAISTTADLGRVGTLALSGLDLDEIGTVLNRERARSADYLKAALA